MMCTGKQDEQGECSQAMNMNMNMSNIHHQTFQDHHFLLQNQIIQQQQQQTLIFPSDHHHHHHQVVPPILHQQPWPNLPPPNLINPTRFDPITDPFLAPLPQPAGLFPRRQNHHPSLQFGYDGSSNSDLHNHNHNHHLRILADSIVGVPGQPGSGGPFGLQAELGKMTAQEIMDAKALAASKSHSEAERRRRERINNHLAKLRSLLPSTTKTDKASLLAEVIQHVKELKRQTSLIAETSPVPTETDELIVDNASDDEGHFVIKASLCCEDRSDLIPDLIKTLKGLRLRTLKAEITTLGGRVKNVLFVTGDHHEDHSTSSDEDCQVQHDQHNINNNNNNINQPQYCITSIQEALKAVIEKKSGDQDSSSGSVKRQRTTNNNINIYP